VPQRIRVDTDNLRKYADAFDRIAALIGDTGPALIRAATSVKDYGGQLPCKKDALAAQAEASDLRSGLQDDAGHLRMLADLFDKVDQEAVQGMAPPPPCPPYNPPPDFKRFLPHFRFNWDPDTKDGTATRPGDNDFGPTQNLDLRKILNDPNFYVPPKRDDDFSHKLCGVLCAFRLAGVDLRTGLLIMLADPRFAKILKGDSLTTAKDLWDLLQLLGANPGEIQTFPSGTKIDPAVFRQILDDGGQIVVLVNAYCPPGTVTDPAKGMYSSHWVTVDDMWYDSEGTLWVEVYNPYNNQYEAYRWDTLEAAMQSSPGSPGGGYYIPVYPGNSQSNTPGSGGGTSANPNG
jgi:hypothetical protein